MESYVFSRSLKQSPNARLQIVSENPVGFVEDLKKRPGRDIYLCGGADLSATLLAANLIDEIVVKLNPLLIGSGVPLFPRIGEPADLELFDSKRYDPLDQSPRRYPPSLQVARVEQSANSNSVRCANPTYRS